MTFQRKKIDYIHFDTIDSTSQWTKAHAATLDQERVTCITALEQTAGRGRANRSWLSPRGQNIYATLYFTLPLTASYVVNLGQILSLSCCTILQTKGFHPQIKWPNDILLEGKKVAGILCETLTVEDQRGIVIGIGINVNMTQELLNTIDQPATSLEQLSGHSWGLEQILGSLVEQFFEDLTQLQAHGFAHFLSRYETLLAYRGQLITCQDGAHTVRGILHCIDESGKLHLRLEDGNTIALSAGEIIPQKNI